MDFVVGESILIDDGLSDYELLATFFHAAEERGHPAPSIVVDQDGRPVTHPAYADLMGLPHLRSGVWAFRRKMQAEALGLPAGTDWVRASVPHRMFENGSPYLNVPHTNPQLYVQRFDDPQPHVMAPVCSAGPVAFSSDGQRICVQELGRVVDGTGAAETVLWEYELATGSRRRIAGFPHTAELGPVELSYSHDGAFLLICDWASGRNLLVRVSDGWTVNLPIRSAAVAWNPRSGPSAMVFMVTDQVSGRLKVFDYDLATGGTELRAEVVPVNGIPVVARHLTISVDERALVTAGVGMVGVDLMARGGVQVVAHVDLDTGTIDGLMPVPFRTAGAQRRHTSPRWCDDVAAIARSATVLADALLDSGAVRPCEPDPPSVAADLVESWLETLDGIMAAWERGRTAPTAFAQEFTQYMMSTKALDHQRTEDLERRLDELARTDSTARQIRAWLPSGNRLWFRVPEDAPLHAGDNHLAVDTLARGALDDFIGASDLGTVLSATRALVASAHRVERPPAASGRGYPRQVQPRSNEGNSNSQPGSRWLPGAGTVTM